MVKRSQSRADLAGLTAEEKRLEEDKKKQKYWRRWGPYMAERQWVSIRSIESWILYLECFFLNTDFINVTDY